jgi:hypothetical protein
MPFSAWASAAKASGPKAKVMRKSTGNLSVAGVMI